MKLITVTAAVLMLALAGCAAAAAQRPLLIFVLGGQSNMAGNDQTIPAEDPIPGVYDVTFGTLRPAVDSLGAAGGFGPGRAIGAELERLYPNVDVGLVMCAKGGSYLSESAPGGDLYQPCVDHTLAAAKTLGGTVVGVFFGQGERDAQFPDLAATWSQRFVAAMTQFRTDIGRPDLPIVFSQLGMTPVTNTSFVAWSTVQDQQQQTSLPGSSMIATSDIPSDLHYDWDGYQRLGVRYADAWAKIDDGRDIPTPPTPAPAPPAPVPSPVTPPPPAPIPAAPVTVDAASLSALVAALDAGASTVDAAMAARSAGLNVVYQLG